MRVGIIIAMPATFLFSCMFTHIHSSTRSRLTHTHTLYFTFVSLLTLKTHTTTPKQIEFIIWTTTIGPQRRE
jgi:hypothetical protein